MSSTLNFEDREYKLIATKHEWRSDAGVVVRLTETYHIDGKTKRTWGVMAPWSEHFREALQEEAEMLETALCSHHEPMQFPDVIAALHYLVDKCAVGSKLKHIDLENCTLEFGREDFCVVNRFRIQADACAIYVEFMGETACVRFIEMERL